MESYQQLDLFPNQSIQSIINDDCLEVMRTMESSSITHIVTDPPYGLGFMGKKWDSEIPCEEYWIEALRVCSPGAMLLCFGGTRTYHRLACAIEDAGWEIRDCLMWIYGSGFPKSHNHFGFEGYGTALKPAYEPIIMAMKPLDGTFAQNAEKHGVAGINIDECRIETNDATGRPTGTQQNCYGKYEQITTETNPMGRWPANILFDEAAAEMLDEQSGNLKSGGSRKNGLNISEKSWKNTSKEIISYNDIAASEGGASRFFYCAKASSSERNEGLEGFPDKIGGGMRSTVSGDTRNGHITIQKNNHPTVKPIKLMEYLLKLVTPPNGGIVLDPFMGSGTTLLAAKNLDINAIGIEKSADYCEIAKGRLKNG